MIQNDVIASQFQTAYYEGERKALSGLYAELRYMATIVLKGKAIDDAETKAHDVSSRIITRYLQHPGYKIKYFRRVVRNAVLNEISGNGNGHYEDIEIESIPCEEREEIPEIDVEEFIKSHPQGKRIVIDLYRSTKYREAIELIAEYVGREWIYNRAREVYTIWRRLRDKAMRNKEQTMIVLDPEVKAEAKRQCKMYGTSLSKTVNELLKAYIKTEPSDAEPQADG